MINGTIGLKELKFEANSMKQMAAIKTTFIKLTNVQDMEEAKERFPNYANETMLNTFSKLDFRKAVPQSSLDFCTRAKLSQHTESPSNDCTTYVKVGDVLGFIIESKMNEISGQRIKQAYSSFQGANLALMLFEEVCEYMVYMYSYMHVYLYFRPAKRKCKV